MLRKPSIAILILIVALTTGAYGQEKDVFASVSEPQRARLVERVNLLIDYYRSKQWSNLYELMSSSMLQGKSKEKFVKEFDERAKNNSDALPTNFIVQSFTPNAGIDGVIYGCAAYQSRGRVENYLAGIEAQWEKNNWYFSTISVILPIDGKPKPCTNKFKRPQAKARCSPRHS